jgi:hypothetical protein
MTVNRAPVGGGLLQSNRHGMDIEVQIVSRTREPEQLRFAGGNTETARGVGELWEVIATSWSRFAVSSDWREEETAW